MREIKFRGKSLEGKWVYGLLTKMWGQYHIIDENDENTAYPVHIETIGERTPCRDIQGEIVWEGDILRDPPDDEWEEKNFMAYEVFFHDNDCADQHIGFQMNRTHCIGSICGGSILPKFIPKWTKKMIVIGNIHDNPELLK